MIENVDEAFSLRILVNFGNFDQFNDINFSFNEDYTNILRLNVFMKPYFWIEQKYTPLSIGNRKYSSFKNF